jgi:heme-degrading monooxygenase HmoA
MLQDPETMLIRIWRTHIDETRAPEYEAFARQRSLPMLRAQRGCVGVLFARDGASCAVISFWRDAAAVDALERSASYVATAAELAGTGMIVDRASVEVFELHGGCLDETLLPRDILGAHGAAADT